MKKLENFIKQYFTQIITLSLISSLYVALVDATARIGQISFNPIKAFQMTMAYGGFSITNFLTILVLIGIGTILIGYTISNKKEDTNEFGNKRERDKQAKTYGSAHFEEPEEFKDIADVAPATKIEGTIYGEYVNPETRKTNGDVLGRKPSFGIPNDHNMIFGATGVGKSRTIVKNMIFQIAKNHESMILTDLKGELYEDMVPYLISMGYLVKMFNLKNFSKSDGWDILKCIDLKHLTEDVPRVSNTLIENAVLMYPSGGGDAVYKEGAKSLLSGLIALILTCNAFVEGKSEKEFNLLNTAVENMKVGDILGTKTLTTIVTIIAHPQVTELLDFLFKDEHLSRMGGKEAKEYYNVFRQGSDNLRNNILVNMNTYLNPLRNKALQEILSSDDMKIEDLENRPTAFFCITDSVEYRPIAAVFFNTVINTLKTIADSRTTRCLHRKIHFVLDEFPNIGILPDWAGNMATIRSQGMVATMISQDISLLENCYGNTTSSIISNCATIVSLGVHHIPTAEFLAGYTGMETVMTKTERRKRWDFLEHLFFGKAEKYNKAETGVEFLSAADILNLSTEYNIVWFQGHNPILCKKFPYTKHPEYKNMPRLNGEIYKRKILTLPDINTPERDALSKQENFYSENYCALHKIPISFKKERIDSIDEFKAVFVPLKIDNYDTIFSFTADNVKLFEEPYEEQSANSKNTKPHREKC